MGGSGNSSRTPSQSEGVKPTAAIQGDTVSTGEREPRGEGGKKDTPKLYESKETLDRKAKELEQRRAVKAMTSAKRIEHFASKTMKDRAIKAQYKAWEKAGSPGGHQKGWVQDRLAKINKGWNRTGKKNWISKNKKAAQIIRAKAAREEAWRKNPGQFSV